MYATNLHDQLINAALPLKPLTAWPGGACTVTVAVPPAQSTVGVAIDSVRVELELPSGQTASADAVNVSGSPNWAATFAAELFATSGFVANGLTVYLGGKDERSASRVWIVSKGDLEVKAGDAAPSPSGSYVVVKLRDSAPTSPHRGDAYISGGTLYVYDGSAWQAIGGGGGGVVVDDEIDAESTNPVRNSAIAAALDGKQAALSSSQLAAVNSGVTSEKVATWDGYAAQISQKASLTDLPYRLVTPGEWEFSGLPSGVSVDSISYAENLDEWIFTFADGVDEFDVNVSGSETDTSLSFNVSGNPVTATRTLPGHLLDRAVNRVEVSDATTLTLPAAITGYARDFLVKVTTSADDLNITWQGQGDEAPSGADELQFVTEDGDFPVVGTAGDYLFSFTEVEAHTFAVSMKALVAAPQAQGGV